MTIKDEPKALHNDVFIETIFEQPACIASHFELKGNSSKNINICTQFSVLSLVLFHRNKQVFGV